MPNPFDHLARAAVTVVQNQFGYTATWLPANETDVTHTQIAQVLFSNPTTKGTINEQDFDDDGSAKMEYDVTQFVGLLAEAKNPRNKSKVTIEGIQYQVRKVKRKWDGKAYIAYLAIIEQ